MSVVQNYIEVLPGIQDAIADAGEREHHELRLQVAERLDEAFLAEAVAVDQTDTKRLRIGGDDIGDRLTTLQTEAGPRSARPDYSGLYSIVSLE